MGAAGTPEQAFHVQDAFVGGIKIKLLLKLLPRLKQAGRAVQARAREW